MSHFLRGSEAHRYRAVGKVWAAVTVERRKDDLVIQEGGVVVLKMDALVAPLPERIRVVSPKGEVIKPSEGKQFLVTLETCCPFHAICELEV
jgi:hypothetical protein